jgi:predicted transcriptional regulator
VNQEAILAVLPDSKDDAKSLKEIANEMGLDITAYVDWIRAERRLSSSLRALARWGYVDQERRQRDEGQRFWYNAYWKTELAE